VDIFPTITSHLGLQIPEDVHREVDGVPFVGPIDVSELHAEKSGNKIKLTWNVIDQTNDKAEILVSETNNFKTGGKDDYKKVGEVPISQKTFEFELEDSGTFHKILLKTPRQYANVWLTETDVQQ
jgi:hypothetical protein